MIKFEYVRIYKHTFEDFQSGGESYSFRELCADLKEMWHEIIEIRIKMANIFCQQINKWTIINQQIFVDSIGRTQKDRKIQVKSRGSIRKLAEIVIPNEFTSATNA